MSAEDWLAQEAQKETPTWNEPQFLAAQQDPAMAAKTAELERLLEAAGLSFATVWKEMARQRALKKEANNG